MHDLLQKLASVAASLDQKGLKAEADIIDSVLTRVAEDLTDEQRQEVESLFPADMPKATSEQMAAKKKEEAEKARREEAMRRVKEKQRKLQDFQGLVPRTMPPVSTETHKVDKVHTVRPEDTPIPPRKQPLPTPKVPKQ